MPHFSFPNSIFGRRWRRKNEYCLGATTCEMGQSRRLRHAPHPLWLPRPRRRRSRDSSSQDTEKFVPSHSITSSAVD